MGPFCLLTAELGLEPEGLNLRLLSALVEICRTAVVTCSYLHHLKYDSEHSPSVHAGTPPFCSVVFAITTTAKIELGKKRQQCRSILERTAKVLLTFGYPARLSEANESELSVKQIDGNSAGAWD